MQKIKSWGLCFRKKRLALQLNGAGLNTIFELPIKRNRPEQCFGTIYWSTVLVLVLVPTFGKLRFRFWLWLRFWLRTVSM
jgi:hypothetical protein